MEVVVVTVSGGRPASADKVLTRSVNKAVVLVEEFALDDVIIALDETPIQVYMQRIHGQLVSRGRMAFSELFAGGMHKSSLVSIFLAMMELVRHHGRPCHHVHERAAV